VDHDSRVKGEKQIKNLRQFVFLFVFFCVLGGLRKKEKKPKSGQRIFFFFFWGV